MMEQSLLILFYLHISFMLESTSCSNINIFKVPPAQTMKAIGDDSLADALFNHHHLTLGENKESEQLRQESAIVEPEIEGKFQVLIQQQFC